MDMGGMLADRRAMQRRSALRALGIGVTAVATAQVAAEAKGNKNRKNHKAKDRCPGQVAPCEAAFAEICTNAMPSDECRAAVHECCASLETCDAGSTMDCIVFRFLTA